MDTSDDFMHIPGVAQPLPPSNFRYFFITSPTKETSTL